MTVVNNVPPANNGNNGMGFLLGIIVLAAFFLFVFYYGLPYLHGGMGTQLNIPNKIDVNVNHK